MQTNELNGKLIIALSRALQSIHKESEVLFRQNNLTMAQFAVLEALLHKGDVTIGVLIDAVLSSSGNMTVVLRNLERQGWVRRAANPKDKRSFLICLTDEGRALIEAVFAAHMARVASALSPLTAAEKETIIAMVKRLS